MLEGNVAQDVLRNLFEDFKVPFEGVDKDGEETISGDRHFDVKMPDGSAIDVWASARADGRFPDYPDERGSLFEFKTMSGYKPGWFQKAYDGRWKKATGKTPDERAIERIRTKHAGNYEQVQITMAVFEEDRTFYGHKDCGEAQFGLVDKDGKRRGVVIERDDAEIARILKDFAEVVVAVKAEKAPKAKFLDGEPACSWCPFYYRCHGATKRMQRGLEPAVLYPGEEDV
jgi:hypothetical protein